MQAPCSKEKLIKLFRDGKWHNTTEVFEVGGFGGMRRLQELRLAFRAGKHSGLCDIEKRKIYKSAQFEYRFVRGTPSAVAAIHTAKAKVPIDRESKIVERKQELEARQPAINVFNRGGRR